MQILVLTHVYEHSFVCHTIVLTLVTGISCMSFITFIYLNVNPNIDQNSFWHFVIRFLLTNYILCQDPSSS